MGFEPTCPEGKRFSRPPRYDHFDNPPYELVNTERFEKWLAAGKSASWLIGESRYNPPYELVNTERFEKWLAAGKSASWLIGKSRYNPPYELVPAYSTTPIPICQESKSKKAVASDSLLITGG